VDQLAIHFQIDGNLIHKESEDAKRQVQLRKDMPELAASAAEQDEHDHAAQQQQTQSAGTGGGAAEDDDDEEKKASKSSMSGGKEKKLTNQFNFSERASQSYNNPTRERETMTEPPPRATFSSNATQWEIYDAYIEDFEQQVCFSPSSFSSSSLGGVSRF
jgi:dynein intermediate chain 1